MQQSKMLATGKGETEFKWYSEPFSRPLLAHNYSDKKTLSDAVLKLCFKLKIQPRAATVTGLEVLLLDLFERYESSNGFSTVGLFTSNGSRTAVGSQQYKYLGFVGKALKSYLSKFEYAGLIETFPGCIGHSTKVRATLTLIEELKALGITTGNIRYRKINPVVYTNESGDNVRLESEYAEAAGVSVLETYNELLAQTDIRVGSLHLRPYEKQVRRIFKNKEGTKDGRHYGAIWQVLSGDGRSKITINGYQVSECDIKSAHPLIAYSLNNKDLTLMRVEDFDPYQLKQLKDFHDQTGLRELVKSCTLMMINCSSRYEVSEAIQGKVNKSPRLLKVWRALKDKGIGNDDLVQMIKKNNIFIMKYFFTGSWDLFNYHESNIAQRVIEHFTKKGVIVLTVYDSFLIQDESRDELKQVLTESIEAELVRMFMSRDSLSEWKKGSSTYTDTDAEMELTNVRTYRDKFN